MSKLVGFVTCSWVSCTSNASRNAVVCAEVVLFTALVKKDRALRISALLMEATLYFNVTLSWLPTALVVKLVFNKIQCSGIRPSTLAAATIEAVEAVFSAWPKVARL